LEVGWEVVQVEVMVDKVVGVVKVVQGEEREELATEVLG
jgi:hypothetical protein